MAHPRGPSRRRVREVLEAIEVGIEMVAACYRISTIRPEGSQALHQWTPSCNHDIAPGGQARQEPRAKRRIAAIDPVIAPLECSAMGNHGF